MKIFLQTKYPKTLWMHHRVVTCYFDRNSSSPSCPKIRKNVSLRTNGYEVRFIGDNLFLFFFCQPRVREEISFFPASQPNADSLTTLSQHKANSFLPLLLLPYPA